jgi:hypothetical protein
MLPKISEEETMNTRRRARRNIIGPLNQFGPEILSLERLHSELVSASLEPDSHIEAIRLANKTIALYPDDTFAYYKLANVQLAAGSYQQAIESATWYIDHSDLTASHSLKSYAIRSTAYLKLEKFDLAVDDAERIYAQAASVDRHRDLCVTAYCARAEAALAANKPEEALADAMKAIGLKQEFMSVELKVKALIAMKDYKQAIAFAKIHSGYYPGLLSLNSKASLLYAQELFEKDPSDDKEALATLETTYTYDDEDKIQCHRLKAKIHLRLQQYEAVHRCVKKLIEWNASDTEAYFYQAAAFICEKKFHDARKAASQVITLAPRSDRAAAYALSTQIELVQSNYDGAHTAINKALLECRADDKALLLNLRGEIHFRQGKFMQAIDTAAEALTAQAAIRDHAVKTRPTSTSDMLVPFEEKPTTPDEDKSNEHLQPTLVIAQKPETSMEEITSLQLRARAKMALANTPTKLTEAAFLHHPHKEVKESDQQGLDSTAHISTLMEHTENFALRYRLLRDHYFSEAQEDAERLIELSRIEPYSGTEPVARALLAWVLLLKNEGKSKAAGTELALALKQAPRDLTVNLVFAMHSLREESYDNVINAANILLANDPTDIQALRLRAEGYKGLRKYREAVLDEKKAYDDQLKKGHVPSLKDRIKYQLFDDHDSVYTKASIHKLANETLQQTSDPQAALDTVNAIQNCFADNLITPATLKLFNPSIRRGYTVFDQCESENLSLRQLPARPGPHG